MGQENRTNCSRFCEAGPVPLSRNPHLSIPNSQPATRHSQLATFLPGFSFAEVMFAVVILGIGFILVAAIFPVAIQQSQATGEESSAASVAREAANAIAAMSSTMANPNVPPAGSNYLLVSPSQSIQTLLVYPPTVKNYALGTTNTPPSIGQFGSGSIAVAPPAIVVPFSGVQYEAVKGNAILASDPRYAYSIFYKRENNSSVMQLIVVATTARAKPIYDPTVDSSATSATVSVSTARQFSAAGGLQTIVCNDTIVLGAGTATSYEGYTVNPNILATTAYGNGYPAGRYYHIGRQLSGTSYELDPGGNMSLTAGTGGLWGVAGGVADTQLITYPSQLIPPTNLQPVVAYAQINAVPDRTGGRIHIVTSPTNPTPPLAAGTGAFVIVADDYPYNPQNPQTPSYALPPNATLPLAQQNTTLTTPSTPTTYTLGALNGRIFRLGAPISEDLELPVSATDSTPTKYPPGVYDLDPQYGMRPPRTTPGYFPESPDTFPPDYLLQNSPGSGSLYAKVYIIGIGKDGQGNYGKNAQDIGVYSTYVPVQ